MFNALLASLSTLASVPLSLALVHGIDTSQAVSSTNYSIFFQEGFTHLVIGGYQEACSTGGRVNPNFVGNYRSARAVGYTNIDTAWFPCTGSLNPCKSYSQQIAELGGTFIANGMNIGTIWVDMEIDSICEGWDYGASGNLQQAQAIVAALRASGFAFGIYSSPGEWGSIFGSQGVVLDNTIPLWFATFDGNDTSLNLSSPFGGWTTAFGKQYSGQSSSGLLFDLDIFEF